MADWRRRSIAGGPSPSTPNEDIPGALHLDFFYRPSAARISFSSDGAGGTSQLEAAIMSTPRWTLANALTDEAFLLPAADGDSKMAVASPATTDEASPLQPRQCQPVGTAATGGGGSGSRRQLSFVADHVAVSLDNNEAGEEGKKHVSLLCDEVLDEDDMSSGRSDGDYEGMSSGRGEDDDEAISPGRGEDYDKAMSSGHSEEDDEDEEEEEEEPQPRVRGMCYEVLDEDDISSGRSDGDYEGMSSGDGEEDGEDEDDAEDGEDEDDDDADDEEEEEEEPQGPVMCGDCGIGEASLMLMPCRDVCYCAACYENARGDNGPAGVPCLDCGQIAERAHPLSGRLEPKKKSR